MGVFPRKQRARHVLMVILDFAILVMVIIAIMSFLVSNLFGAPWIPTPKATVNKMLSMAGVKPGEIVYDLGSGDGRIIIAAANDFHARSVGIDISPVWFLWAHLMVSILGLRGQVSVVWGNLFNVDLSKADVVTLYLLQDTNDKLKQKLERELKPGSRVVSHVFTFTGWKQLETDDESKLYLYKMGETAE